MIDEAMQWIGWGLILAAVIMAGNNIYQVHTREQTTLHRQDLEPSDWPGCYLTGRWLVDPVTGVISTHEICYQRPER